MKETGGAIRAEARALAALLVGAVCIAFAPLFVRLSEIPPTATAFDRMLLAVPVFLLVASRGEGETAENWERGRVVRWVVLAGLFFAGDLAVWHWSIHYTTVANATLLANFAPVFVTLASWLWFGERVTGLFLVGMALALGGASMLVRASASIGGDALVGDLLGILTAVFYGGYLVSVKQARKAVSTPRLMAGSTLVSCLALGAITAALGEPLFPSTPRGWAVVAGVAFVSQCGGQGLIAFGLAHLPASFSSVTLLVQPVTAALLAWGILGERLGALQILGGALVLTGIFLARRASRAEAAEPEAPPCYTPEDSEPGGSPARASHGGGSP